MALNQALEQISIIRNTGHIERYHVFTDSSTLAKAIEQTNLDVMPSWKATQIVARSIQLVQQMEGRVLIKFVGRKYVEQAHNLANWARKTKTAFNGYPGETFREGMKITTKLDPTRFGYGNSSWSKETVSSLEMEILTTDQWRGLGTDRMALTYSRKSDKHITSFTGKFRTG